MPLLGSEEAGQGSIELAAGIKPQGTPGGPFPGFGGAPPAVAGASSAGASGLASRSDHTHQGVASVAAGDSLIPVTTAGAAATVGPQLIQANWTLANTRWYAVDTANGNDLNAGFSDVSSAAAGAVAKKTLAGLAAIFPRNGAGRKVAVVIAQGTYTGGLDTFLAGVYGYAANFPLVVATGTNSTAGAVAFAGDANDRTYAGAVTVPGLNAAGYNPIGTPTATVIQCQLAGGGAPAFPAEPAEPLGWRIRFDVNTATVALRNVCATIAQVTTDTLTVCRTPSSPIGLPATPALTDVFYVEKPGVTCDNTFLSPSGNPPSASPATALSLQVVGININSAFRQYEGRSSFSLCTIPTATTSAAAQFQTSFTYTDETGTTRTPCGGRNTGGLTMAGPLGANQNSGTPIILAAGALSLNAVIRGQFQNGSYAAGGLALFNCIGENIDPGLQPTFEIGGRVTNTQITSRIVGSTNVQGSLCGLGMSGSKVSIGRLAITGQGANPAIKLFGQCGLAVSNQLSGSTGNTDVGLDLTLSQDSIILVLSTPTLTGTAGDIRLAGGQIVTWAAVAATGIVDSQGNRFISAIAPLQLLAKFSGTLVQQPTLPSGTYLSDVGELAPTPYINDGTPQGYGTSLRLISRLRVTCKSGTGGKALVVTLYKNNVATAMTVTIPASSAPGTTGADLAHPILFADGDTFDVVASMTSGTGDGPYFLSATLEGPC